MTEWPALAFEERAWEPAVAVEHLTRRQRAQLRPTYEAAVPPQIAGLGWQPSPGLAADLDDITAEVARFDEASPIALEPMAGLLLRSEAAASSRIERLTASARAILSAEVGDLSRPNAVAITQNTAALTEAVALAHEPDAASLLAMHRTLLSGVDSHAGQWRQQEVWIGGSDHGPFGADFVPPHHERVPELIDDLVAFMRRDDLPVLAHAALAHAQFETIHPFTDGNGRTGRALLHALLRTKGLTRRVTVPVSAGLLVDTGAYFAALDAYREGEPDVVVERVAGAAVRGVQQASLLVDELVEVHAGWVEAVQARSGSAPWRLLELLRGRPVVTAAVIQSELGLAAPNVRRAVAPLVEAGVLVESRMPLDGRRLVWRAPQALAALDRFAERSGRRSLS